MVVATASALEGLGMPAQLAQLLGAEPVTQAGTGTSQTGATVLRSKSVELTTSGGNTAFILASTGGQSNTTLVNEPVLVFCSSATSALVFVPSGHTLNGTLNGSLTVAQNKSAWIWQYKRTFWASVLTA